jgi:hypothetical protein
VGAPDQLAAELNDPTIVESGLFDPAPDAIPGLEDPDVETSMQEISRG